MPEPITLQCTDVLDDSLVISASTDCNEPTVLLNPTTVDGSGVIHLNKDSARALFNWLGVWLHTQ